MVEYSLDLDIPDYVFDNPIVISMSEATTDIMTWPNVSCLFYLPVCKHLKYWYRISAHST